MKNQTVFSLLAFGGLIAFSRLVFGQETAEIPPPKFPIKLRAAEKAQWTITTRGKGAGDSSSSADSDKSKGTSQLILTKTAPIYQEQAGAEGSGMTQWIFVTPGGVYRLAKPPGGQGWARVQDSYYLKAASYKNSDFENFDWISEKNYKGVQVLNNVPTYFFEESSSSPITRQDDFHYDVGSAVTGDNKTRFVAKAWLDPKTLLPVRFEDNRQVQAYTFGAAPTERLTPPADVLEALKKWLVDVKQMNR